ncbi:SDR family oxidoreductase [Actinomadura sp. GTD37]|uniref:SDR family oxidoreductase n=1 Tax=Actinomadura sp. GTD37 TaxID=1778030 RepID=UPI0035C17F3A
MILVTGATGNMGVPLVRRLRETGIVPRVTTRNARRAQGILPDGVEIAEGDLTEQEFLERALRGVDGLFLFLEAGDPVRVLEAAGRAGVRRVVLVSSLLAETRPASFVGRLSLGAERAMREGGFAGTVLRPWEFASNTLAWAEEIRRGDAVRKPSAGVPSPVIDPADVAEVAARVLADDAHDGRTYALTGPAELTAADKVRAIGEALGRRLAFQETADPELMERIRTSPEEVAEDFGVCFMQSPGVRTAVQDVTGRPARTFEEWASDHAGSFK